MPRPLPPGGQRRKPMQVKCTDDEARPVVELADAEYGGNLSDALRRIIAEWAAGHRGAGDSSAGAA